MKTLKTIPDGPESNAGDDFHVMWTIKKSFELLNFEAEGLQAITVEGIPLIDKQRINPYGDKLLGVDIAEYFGGADFITARKVTISQLKYSTRRSDENWTIAKITKGKKKGSFDGSIVHRLSSIYKAHLDKFGRGLVLEKMKFKLISNRPFNQSQTRFLSEFQQYLIKRGLNVTLKNLMATFPNNLSEIKTLLNASKLKDKEFIDFLKLLDISDCGVNSRLLQKFEIIKAINKLNLNSGHQYSRLFEMIWNKMMPESHNNKITKEDLLICFDFDSIESLFPVSQKFEKLSNVVERDQVLEIVNEFENNTSNHYCLHGAAGVGKSIISGQISQMVRDYNVCIVYDCYGGGDYMNPSDQRHLHKEAFLHLSNEMAVKLGTQFLLLRKESNAVYLKEWKKRVEEGVAILRTINPKALLIFIIDASDNSITAAESSNSTSFIQDLVNEPLSEGCKIILTTRTNRVPILNLPDIYNKIEIRPFAINETRSYLLNYFPNTTVKEAEEFHRLTFGIPRVQAYSIDLKKESIKKAIGFLKPNGKSLDDIFQNKISFASTKLGKSGKEIVSLFFTYLIAMPRPVPISILEKAINLHKDIIVDFATDIWHGLILNNGFLSFRDEDFENFIRQKNLPDQVAYSTMASIFKSCATSVEFASINLAKMLFLANEYEDLKGIVLRKEYMSLPIDPLRNKEVYFERVKLALKISNNEDNNVDLFRLILLSADLAKTNAILKDILVSNVELAIEFDSFPSLQKLLLESENSIWFGSLHFQLAAIYSRKLGNDDLVEKHLETAEKWMSWRSQLKDYDKHKYKISHNDIANGAEAIFKLHGVEKTIFWLNRWKPREIYFTSGKILIKNIIKYSEKRKIRKWIETYKFSLFERLYLINKFKGTGIAMPFNATELIDELIPVILKINKFNINQKSIIIEFCENVISKNNDKNILIILENVSLNMPEWVPSYTAANIKETEAELFLRKATLIASIKDVPIEIKDLYPLQWKVKFNEQTKEGRRRSDEEVYKFDRYYSHAIRVYQFRVDCLFIKKSKPALLKELKTMLFRIKEDWEFRYYDNWAKYKLIHLATMLIDRIDVFQSIDFVDDIILAFDYKDQNRISLRLLIAERLVIIERTKKISLKLLNEINEIIQNSYFEATTIVDYYIKCALIAKLIDRDAGLFYFNLASNSSAKIDIDSFGQIQCISDLTTVGIPASSPMLAYEYSRFVENCKVKLDGYEDFPIDDALKGIANLDLASAFAIACRWDHRYVQDIKLSIVSILTKALKNKFISPTIGSSLLPLNLYYWKEFIEYNNILIQNYNSPTDSLFKDDYVKYLLKDIKINCPVNVKATIVMEIYSFLEDGRFLRPETKREFETYKDYVSNNGNKSENKEIESVHKLVKGVKKKYTKTKYTTEFGSVLNIEKEIKKIIGGKDNYSFRSEIDSFLRKLKDNADPENYVNQLNLLISIDAAYLEYYSFETAINERLKEWNSHPSVVRWATEKFPYCFKLWFHHFMWNDTMHIDGINRFASVFSVSQAVLGAAIIEIITERIDFLSARGIYSLIQMIQHRLSQEENERIIRWALSEWNYDIKSDLGDGLWRDTLIPSSNSSEVIALSIRYMLGNPDVRLRWRAAHSLRNLINSNNIEILKILLRDQNKQDCFPYQNESYPFYWMSAKLYLWITIERLANENPGSLLSMSQLFFIELKNDDLPHVLIRYFIRKTSINLQNYSNTTFSKEEFNIIVNLFTSKLNAVSEKYLEREQRKYSTNANFEWTFRFDRLDTLPYWYSRLGRIFNLSEYDVADLAEVYIVNRWGYTGDPYDDNHVHTSTNNEYYLTSKGHGKLPTIENLQTYYEYHAMFCAANDLLELEPMILNDQYYSWDDWLESYALSWKDWWQSDLRDSIPMEKRFWIKENHRLDNEWIENIGEEEYQISCKILDDWIVPFGGYRRYFGEAYESVSIRSAMVSVKMAHALLSALHSVKEKYDYSLPMEDDEFEIEEGNFVLQGWLNEIRSHSDGLDNLDELGEDFGKNYTKFGKRVHDVFEITYDKYFKSATYGQEIISTFETWDDVSERRGNDALQSHGSILTVKKDFILSMLKKLDKCLLLNCIIDRQLSERKYIHNSVNNSKFYLIYPNGQIETITRSNSKAGKKNL